MARLLNFLYHLGFHWTDFSMLIVQKLNEASSTVSSSCTGVCQENGEEFSPGGHIDVSAGNALQWQCKVGSVVQLQSNSEGRGESASNPVPDDNFQSENSVPFTVNLESTGSYPELNRFLPPPSDSLPPSDLHLTSISLAFCRFADTADALRADPHSAFVEGSTERSRNDIVQNSSMPAIGPAPTEPSTEQLSPATPTQIRQSVRGSRSPVHTQHTLGQLAGGENDGFLVALAASNRIPQPPPSLTNSRGKDSEKKL